MNHTDILDKYITVVEVIYDPKDHSSFIFRNIGYVIVEFNHSRFFHRGKKQVKVHISESRTFAGDRRLVIPTYDDPFDDYPFVPFIKYLGISENNISSWFIERYLETLRNQRVDISSISFSV
jgi:hypothetical protein